MAGHRGASGRSGGGLADSGRGADHAGDASDLFQVFAGLGTDVDRPSFGLRLRVATRSRVLDEALARGASPLRSRALALRARQLVQRHGREELATALENLLDGARRKPSRADIVPLPRRQIIDAGSSLTALATRLRDAEPVYAQGAAIVSRLVHDGTGPAYTPDTGPALRHALQAAAEALDGGCGAQPPSDA
jgi:hypothetical protein